MHLNIAPTNPVSASIDSPPIAFPGLARILPDGSEQLVHDQVWPVAGFGEQAVPLPGLSMVLHGNEQLGLVVFGYHPQYFNCRIRIPTSVHIPGLVASLPIVD